jgi:hypothetical protein
MLDKQEYQIQQGGTRNKQQATSNKQQGTPK